VENNVGDLFADLVLHSSKLCLFRLVYGIRQGHCELEHSTELVPHGEQSIHSATDYKVMRTVYNQDVASMTYPTLC
jgi:hypothetical protein